MGKASPAGYIFIQESGPKADQGPGTLITFPT